MKEKKGLTSRELISEIRNEVYTGHGFVPLIGSGMSSPSGIMMGMEFNNYVAYVIWRVVVGRTENGINRKWDLREDGWPKYPTDEFVDVVKKWTYKTYKAICEKNGYRVLPIRDEDVELDASELTVEEVVLPLGTDSPTVLARAINRPLIPRIIQSESAKTWELENRAKQLQRQFQGRGGWTKFDDSGAYSRSSKEFTEELAIRSMHDWRAVLQFLSQARLDRTSQRVYVEDFKDDTVVDSFNVHIARDKQISLGHKMITHLSRPMRIRTILTTNFDRLIEQAFMQQMTTLKVIPVSVKGRLPNAQTVRSQNTLVKLHGDSIETRADFSLDEEPSASDKEAFVRYLRGEFDESRKTAATPNHMIVMGFSGSDMRIIQMMKYLLDTHDGVRIFWISHQAFERRKIQQIFGDEYMDNMEFHQTKRPDLFLYELYQELALCLPSGGFSYEFTHKVPPLRMRNIPACKPELIEKVGRNESIDRPVGMSKQKVTEFNIGIRQGISEKLGNHLATALLANKMPSNPLYQFPVNHSICQIEWKKKWPAPNASSEQKLKVHASAASNCLSATVYIASGGAGVFRECFKTLSKDGVYCIWLELQDYSNVNAVAQDLLRIMALRVGVFQLEHVVLLPAHDESKENLFVDQERNTLKHHIKRLFKLFGISRRRWVVFLYGRNVPGSCAGWANTPWKEKDNNDLEGLIRVLSECGIHVVYLPLTNKRVEQDKNKIDLINEGVVAEKLKEFSLLPDANVNGAALNAWNELMDSIEHSNQENRKLVEASAIDFGKLESEVKLAPNKFKIYDSLLLEALNKWINPKHLSRLQPAENARNYLSRVRNPKHLRQEQPAENVRDYLSRVRFLYAITLFRQSRHTSAFFSEATFKCPNRFNRQGIDNDWNRAESVRDWIFQLGDLNVFYYKPGGYSWKYRDMRLGLRSHLESMPLFKYWESVAKIFELNDAEKTGIAKLDFFRQSRARQHYWIGDWYFKAFTATGHYLPVIESLYHRFETLKHITSAKPSSMSYAVIERVEYQIILCRVAVMDMIKTLRIARTWMKFWLSGVNGHAMLDDIAVFEKPLTEFVAYIQSFEHVPKDAEKIEKYKDWCETELKTLISSLKDEIQRLQISLKGEAGNFPERRWIQPSIPKEVESEREYDFGEGSLSYDNCVGRDANEFDKEFRNCFKKLDAKFVYKVIDKYFKNRPVKEVDSKLNKGAAKWVINNFKPMINDANSPGWAQDDSSLLCLVHHVADYAYLYVKRAKMEAAAVDLTAPENDDELNKNRMRWGQVTILCLLGIDLCKHLHPHFIQTEIGLKVKINTIYGLALANLGRGFEGHRHFNEAKALHSKASRSMDAVELAIIRLRRAESYLIQADRIAQVLDVIPKQPLDIVDDEQLYELRAEQERRLTDVELKPEVETQFEELCLLNAKQSASKILELEDLIIESLRKISGIKYTLESEVRDQDEVLLDPLIYHAFYVSRKAENTVPEKDVVEEYRKRLMKHIHRIHSATLDDAWTFLESAEKLLAGFSQSSLWWGELAALKLRAYGQVRSDAKFESLVFRRKVQHDREVVQLFSRLLLISPNSPYAKLTAIELTANAMRALTQQLATTVERFTRNDWNELCETLDAIKSDCDSGLLKLAFGRVKVHLKKLEPKIIGS